MNTTESTAQQHDTSKSGNAGPDQSWRVVHRLITPGANDLDKLPLYADFNPLRRVNESAGPRRADVQHGGEVRDRGPSAEDASLILDRRRIRLPENRIISFGTYFNAFPASYWRAWTDVESVRLTVRTDGPATVLVYRSSARGTANRHARLVLEQGGDHHIDLPLTNFGDGGWYWFDLQSSSAPVVLEEATWSVPAPPDLTPGRVTIAVTTFNRPEFCVRQIDNIAGSPDLLEVLDRFIITDQGNRNVKDEPGYAEAAARLGDKLKVIEQANLGGSGGFARGMYETVQNEQSDYVLLLDDDVEAETEGIVRAASFADFARTPTIVGGHMFNLYERTVLHTFGEAVNEWRFFWGPVQEGREAHDFSQQNLRVTPWMHRRVDVDFNGWWMCLIPTRVIREIGLSLPVFIKWDDAEFGLRAKAHGYPTVSLPGVAVWHVPWTEKDDTIDWQAYYHQRNRVLAALLYSPYKHGGSVLRESFMVDVKHLLSMQYSAVELRLQALDDILRGPDHLHATLPTKLPEIRAERQRFTDAQVATRPSSFPAPRRLRPPRKGKVPQPPKNVARGVLSALTGAARQLREVPSTARTWPEARVPAMDARWWRLANLDSAVVSTADGVGASWYIRDRDKFQRMLLRSIRAHMLVRNRWNRLSDLYRGDLRNFTSAEAWETTFRRSS